MAKEKFKDYAKFLNEFKINSPSSGWAFGEAILNEVNFIDKVFVQLPDHLWVLLEFIRDN